MPVVAIQKCHSTSWFEYSRSFFHNHGTMQYMAPKLMKPTQPSAPECTWPMVQSV